MYYGRVKAEADLIQLLAVLAFFFVLVASRTEQVYTKSSCISCILSCPVGDKPIHFSGIFLEAFGREVVIN